MHLRIAHFTVAPGNRASAVAIADSVGQLIRAQPGCARFEFCNDNETGDCAFVVQWHTKQDADAALQVTRPELGSALARAGGTMGNLHLFELVESK